MEDDLTFGASVWGSTEPANLFPAKQSSSTILPSPSASAPQTDDDFDDFDDFGSAAEAPQSAVDDDDFGDFGDADEMATPADFTSPGYPSEIPIAGPSRAGWEALRLNPFPSRDDLVEQINDILDAVWSGIPVSQYLTDDGIRDVEGVNQILQTNESLHPLQNLPTGFGLEYGVST
ncbi:hypothetical protein MPER_08680 [Moniliophthora perniciosa FA553]|nr:hypothetical protein MPER_08680 [Moniliophthora perniciosa FA553]